MPLDPRYQLVTTKYNPARPWTPENAVGIGGAYLCIYGLEGPGGYQLFGRTIQVWNAWRRTRAFTDRPLLRCFDRIRWYPVEAGELLDARAAFPHGRYELEIEDGTFSLAEHQRFLAVNTGEIEAARARRRAAFEAERSDWAARGLNRFEEPTSRCRAGYRPGGRPRIGRQSRPRGDVEAARGRRRHGTGRRTDCCRPSR